MRAVLAVVLLVAGCVKTQSVQCADWTCPENTLCDDAHTGCATPGQFSACTSAGENDVCTADVVEDGRCSSGVCLPAVCGDGFREDNELCDGEQLSKLDCTELGYYYPGELTCNDGCSFEVSECSGQCMDNVFQPEHELCDDSVGPPSQTCVDLGYGAGFLDCKMCGPGLDECKLFGWDLPKSLPLTVRDLHATSVDNVWVAGGNAVMHYNGISWNAVDLTACTPATLQLYSIWSTGTQAIAVGQGMAIHVTATSCTRHAVGSGAEIEEVWGSSPSDVYALGQDGLFHFDGTAWSLVTLTAFGELKPGAVWTSAPDNVWAAKSTLRHFDGNAWTTITGLSDVSQYAAIWGTSKTDVYVSALDADSGSWRVFHFDGASWTVLPALPGQVTAAISANGRVFVAGHDTSTSQTAFAAVLDGDTWLDLAMPLVQGNPLAGLSVTSAGDVFVAQEFEQRVFRAHGTFASSTTAFPFAFPNRLVMRSTVEAYARTSQGDFAIIDKLWQFDGETWQPDALSTVDGFNLELSSGTLFAVNYEGLQKRTASSAWEPCETSITSGRALWAAATDDVWVATPTGLDHADCNDKATRCLTCEVTGLRDMWGTSATDIFAVGDSGKIVHWDGSAWVAQTSGTTARLDAIWGSGPADVYAVGTGGTVLHYNGTAWSPELVGSSQDLMSVWSSSPSDVFVGTEQGELFHRDARGRWAPVRSATTSGIVGISGAGDSVMWLDATRGVHRLTRTFSW